MTKSQSIETRDWQALLTGALGGSVLGAAAAQRWVDSLATSLSDTAPWLLSRSTGLVAFALLWLSMLVGLSISTREARGWPGTKRAMDWHRVTALVGLGFALLHALVLLADLHTPRSLASVVLPFRFAGPTAVALGQLALPLFAFVTLSFWIKRRLGHAFWRSVHFASFVVFALAIAHGAMAGSDTDLGVVRALYWLAAASVGFGTAYRILVSYTAPRRQAAR